MSFQTEYFKLARLYETNKAWRLLRADNAPFVIAFLSELFSEESEIEYGRVRVALDAELDKLRALGQWDADTGAITYLNQWRHAGWLRELNNQLSKTDACDTAIRIVKGLDTRESGTTASHLRIVQEAVRDLAIALSPNVNERITILESQKAALQREIENLQLGFVKKLDDNEQKERIREIYQLASVLTGDFRWVEDQIRELDQDLRIQVVSGETNRGEILKSLLSKEKLMAKSDSGSAFEGFFSLLCDQQRNSEFKQQLNSILSTTAARHLTQRQHQYLHNLLRELTRESDRVFVVRRRTEESLRAYIESGAYAEKHNVDLLLTKLERLALLLSDQNTDPKTQIKLSLDSGSISVSSPDGIRVPSPYDKLEIRQVEERAVSHEPSQSILQYLEVVPVREIAQRMREILIAKGPLTVGQLTRSKPITMGLEELVAMIRVAKHYSATELPDRETVIIIDRDGQMIRADIPKLLMSSTLFEGNIEEPM